MNRLNSLISIGLKLATLMPIIVIAGLFGSVAFAQNVCQQPIAPAVPDGASATKEKMLDVRDDVTAFIKQSDDFQNCLLMEVKNKEDAARRSNTTFDSSFAETVTKQIKDNQSDKVSVANQFNVALKAYNAAHPAQ